MAKEDKVTESAVAKAMAPSLATLKNIESGISKLGAQGNQGAEERIEGARAEKKSADAAAKTNTLLEGVVKGIGDLHKSILKSMKKKISVGLGILLAGITAPIIIMVAFFKQLALEFTFLKKLTGGGLKKLFMPLKNLLSGNGKIANAIKNTLKFIDKAHFGVFTKIGDFFKNFGKSKGITKVSNIIRYLKVNMKLGIRAISNFLDPFGRFLSRIMNMGKALVAGGETATKISKWAGGFGKVLGKLFLPITILMSAFDFVTGFMDGFDEGGILGGLEGGISKLLKGLIGMPLDLLKNVVSWALGKFGFDTTAMDEFSFSDLIGDVVKGFFDMVDGVIGWVKETFSFGSIAESLTSMLKLIWLPATLFKEWLIDPVVGWLGKMFGFDTTKFKEFSVFDGIQTLLEDMGKFFTDIFNIDFKSVLKPMILAVPGGKALWAAAAGLGSLFGGDDKAAAAAEEKRSKKQSKDQKSSDKKTGGGFLNDIKSSFGFGGDDKNMSVNDKMMRGDYGDGSTKESYLRYEAALKEEKTTGGPPSMRKKNAAGGAVKVSPNKVDLKGIDWDFISKKEGGSKTDGYVPNPEGSKSGVTIATGFDLGARGAQDLRGLPLSLKEKLAPYLGLQGMVASQYLETRPLTVTASEAKLIDKMSKGSALKKLKAEWNKNAAIMKKPMFEDLSGAQKTIAASVAFQYGSLAKAPKFRAAAQEGRWEDAEGELRNFGDDYGSRRTSEANYLLAARENKSGGILNDLQVANSNAKSDSSGATVVAPNNSSSTNINNATTVMTMRPTAKDSFWDSAV